MKRQAMRTCGAVLIYTILSVSCHSGRQAGDNSAQVASVPAPCDLGEVKSLLHCELGGSWEVKNYGDIENCILRGSIAYKEVLQFHPLIVANPQTSDKALQLAESIYNAANVYQVSAYNERFLLMDVPQSDELNTLANILKMKVLHPQPHFRDFVVRHCNCVYDKKTFKLRRKAPEPAAQLDD